MQARYVLEDQGMPPCPVAIPLRRDPPHLHLADAVLGHDPLAAQTPVAPPLPARQRLPWFLFHRRMQPRSLVAAVPVPRHPRRHQHPRPVVHLFVLHPPRRRRRHGRDPQPPLLLLPGLAPARPLALTGHNDLVLQRVPFLLAPVAAALSPFGPACRPLGGVEKKFADLVGAQLDAALWDAEEAGQ